MIRPAFTATAITLALAAGALPAPGYAQPVALDFLPPRMAPDTICSAPRDSDPAVDESVEGGEEVLTDRLRLRYVSRDIRRMQNEDAERYFDFIDALITRQAELDPEFAGIEEAFARIELHLNAGRMAELTERDLVGALRDRSVEMTNTQMLELAQYYLNGIGTEPDPTFAQEVIREAAYDGNPRALLEIARMQTRGDLLEDWDAPLDLTLTLAFGGLLGDLTPGVCYRAEQIAREYLTGDVVVANPDTALAWRRFAADMGDAEAAWRVVEHHLNASAADKDLGEMRHYLRLALENGIAIDEETAEALESRGDIAADELEAMLGFNHSETENLRRTSLVPHLELDVNVDGMQPDEDGLYLDYLREISKMPEAPGQVFRRLAEEVLVRRGRWGGEAEAIELLDEATARGDAEAMQTLAAMLMRYRDDPGQVMRAENLLLETVSRFGMESSMDRLDTLYRCQVNDAPRLSEADHWARAYRATDHGSVPISATDLIALDPFKDPETIAKIQSQAIEGRSQAAADFAARLEENALLPAAARRLWAGRLEHSNQTLESFAELEFELARSPAERTRAVELFRRIHLNNGVTTALDLAIALVEDNARDPEIAKEITDLLTMAAYRGEGAAMRLLSRLTTGETSSPEIYEEFAETIETRGDFLALMTAIPHVPQEKVDDYIDRAVSLMKCNTKDTMELGDAYAIRQDAEMAYHWLSVGLHFKNGNSLSKLRLSDAQMAFYDTGRAPGAVAVAARARSDGDPRAWRRLFLLQADPDLDSYDPEAAADTLLARLPEADGSDLSWLLASFRTAPDEVQDLVAERQDMPALFARAAQAGDRQAARDYGLLMRGRAETPQQLAEAARWLLKAAEAGDDIAMTELGRALAYGQGVQRDMGQALDWLDRASGLGNDRAREEAQLLRAQLGQGG